MLEQFWQSQPFAMPGHLRRPAQLAALSALTEHHRDCCEGYGRIVHALHCANDVAATVEDIPFLPVPIFKTLDLMSVPPNAVVRTMTSSGTSGRPVSRIHLDTETARNQARALSMISRTILGGERLPMVVVDQQRTVRDRLAFNARTAAIVGFSLLGRNIFYLLDDEDMRPNWEGLQRFLDDHNGSRILIFGFTAMVWEHLLQTAEMDEVNLKFNNSVLLHGGGWKKLADQQIDNGTFKSRLRTQFSIETIHNYYGMVEQTGSIFLECPAGNLHASAFSDVVVRDEVSLSPSPIGQEGILQVLSVLPTSYPGHSLLTEDRGTLLGEDDCSCGWAGRYFHVHGRLPAAELRGCSDVARPN